MTTTMADFNSNQSTASDSDDDSVDSIYSRICLNELARIGYLVIKKPKSTDTVNHLLKLQQKLGIIDGSHKHADDNGFVRLTTNPESEYDRSIRRPQSDSGNQSPHTDGAFRQTPPAFIVLHCITPAPDGGGVNTLVSAHKVHSFMKKSFPNEYTKLYRSNIYKVIRGEESQESAVFFGDQSEISKLVYSVHEYNQNVIAEDAQEMFCELDRFLHDQSNLDLISLKSGDTLIVDNLRALHGRTCWKDSDGIYRDMLRVWYRGTYQ